MRKVYPEVRARVSFLEIYNEVLEDLLIPAEAAAAAAGGGGGSGGGFMSPPASARGGGHASSSAVMQRLQSGAGAVGVLEPHIVSFEAAKDTLDALAATARGIRPGTGGCVRACVEREGGHCATPILARRRSVHNVLGGLKHLSLVDHPERGTVCLGLSEVAISSSAEVNYLLQRAEERSHYASTLLNKQSNRAHRIFTFSVREGRGGGGE